jgi:hypothetical protein
LKSTQQAFYPEAVTAALQEGEHDLKALHVKRATGIRTAPVALIPVASFTASVASLSLPAIDVAPVTSIAVQLSKLRRRNEQCLCQTPEPLEER